LSGDAQDPADVSSGGCSIARGDTLLDPILYGLLLLAALLLWLRRRSHRRTSSSTSGTRR